MVEVGKGREMGIVKEQVLEVALPGHERMGALFCLCRTCC